LLEVGWRPHWRDCKWEEGRRRVEEGGWETEEERKQEKRRIIFQKEKPVTLETKKTIQTNFFRAGKNVT
jgi:hypothetical protein